ncbi:MAG: Peroxide-responsive repressor PerR [Firmicutes bacterium ADurb.Bin099]|jgi:Fe2+ or Zn2+ uptake regulation protein|nr:MAG: Peroxide-responsive repressor PerR [Firmicutes bacterium ADurb.Bin099]
MKITRNTVQREIILQTVLGMDNHPSADEVYAKLRPENPSISRATVYRNLELLARQGKILHIQTPRGADCFDFNTDEHHHLRCEVCRRVYDINISDIPKIDYDKIDPEGFIINGYNISFYGICPECQKNERSNI